LLNGLFREIGKHRVIPPCQFANGSGREDGSPPPVTERFNAIYELLGKQGNSLGTEKVIVCREAAE
jgi:hypothetical protein